MAGTGPRAVRGTTNSPTAGTDPAHRGPVRSAHRRYGGRAGAGWPGPDLAEFPLKRVAAAAARLADPIAIVDAQRRELLRRLRAAQRAAMAEPDRSDAGLLLEGIVLRLQADLRWLEACERNWTSRTGESPARQGES